VKIKKQAEFLKAGGKEGRKLYGFFNFIKSNKFY
jgi:hypothetical protein